jgi:hypothetical protein
MSRTAASSLVRGSMRVSAEPLLMYWPKVISLESSIIPVPSLVLAPGRRAAIVTLLTLLTAPQAVGRRRFACAGGTSAIRFIEHVGATTFQIAFGHRW